MTREELNTILIEAVERSTILDDRFPAMRLFAEIFDPQEIKRENLEKSQEHEKGSRWFYSKRHNIKGGPINVQYPALFLIDYGTEISNPFYRASDTWEYDLQLMVAYPSDSSNTTDLRPPIFKEELTHFCSRHLAYVFKYIYEYNKANDDTAANAMLNSVNKKISIKKSEDFAGFALVWANFKIQDCMTVEFDENNTLIQSCC